MTLQDLGNIGEFVGALAVVVSLLYLAAQIRQNTRSVQASVYESTARASSDAMMQIALNSEAIDVLLMSADKDYESLSEKDRTRLHFVTLAFFNTYEALFYHHERGNADPELWRSRIVRLRQFAELSYFATWWKRNRASFGERFQRVVDEVQQSG